jgi:hypothetical protein
MSAAVAHARQEWEEGYRRLEALPRDSRHRRLMNQVDLLTDELRRRIGQTFTLADLAEAYAGAERWSRDVIAERTSAPGWPATLSLVEEAAFYLYQRGAVDYAP